MSDSIGKGRRNTQRGTECPDLGECTHILDEFGSVKKQKRIGASPAAQIWPSEAEGLTYLADSQAPCERCPPGAERQGGIWPTGHLPTTVGLLREPCHPAQAVSTGQIPPSLGVVPPTWSREPRAAGRKGGRLRFASRTALSGGLQGENRRGVVTTMENQERPARRVFCCNAAVSSAACKLAANSSVCFSASSRAMP